MIQPPLSLLTSLALAAWTTIAACCIKPTYCQQPQALHDSTSLVSSNVACSCSMDDPMAACCIKPTYCQQPQALHDSPSLAFTSVACSCSMDDPMAAWFEDSAALSTSRSSSSSDWGGADSKQVSVP